MTEPRVDVCDPSAEGPWIVERLRQEGLDAHAVSLADVPLTGADLVLLAGDAGGAIAALKLLRDEGERGDVPVILLGLPPGAQHRGEGSGFGADAVLRRPIDFDPLLAIVEELLDLHEPPEVSGVGMHAVERTLRLAGPLDPDSSQILLSPREAAEAEDTPPPLPWGPREPTLQLPGASESAVSSVAAISSVSSVPLGERSTIGRPLDPPESVVAPKDASARRRARGEKSDVGSRPGTGPAPGEDAPQPVIPLSERAVLSPWLEELLVAADRRVFPERAPLALHFAAANEPPEVLVPPELFHVVSARFDEPVVDDPIDAFTFVGGPAVPPPVAASSGTDERPETTRPGSPQRVRTRTDAPPRRLEQTTATELPGASFEDELEELGVIDDAGDVEEVDEVDAAALGLEEETPGSGVHLAAAYPTAPRRGAWPEDDTVLGRVSPEGSRRGVLGPGGALRLLFRLARLGLDAGCAITTADGLSVRLTLLEGELRAFDGPVLTTVVEGLRRRGRATERPIDEDAAEAVLARRVEAGELGRFERDRLVREAREELLARLVRAERADFTLRRLEGTEGRVARARILARPLPAALVGVARDALSTERVAELLGPDGLTGVGLALGEEREAGLLAAELPSELIELIARLDGSCLADLLAAAPGEPGLAGALYALVAADALVSTEAPRHAAPELASRAAVSALVDAAAALAEDADYFAVLGVAHDADTGAIQRAHRARRAELVALPLRALGLDGLEERRRAALDAVDEAQQVLADPRLRTAYARALA